MKLPKWVSAGCILILVPVLLGGCATPDPEANLKIQPGGYAADAFPVTHAMPYHPADHNSGPFFLKQCSATGHASYYSKSSFFCEDRSFGF